LSFLTPSDAENPNYDERIKGKNPELTEGDMPSI
tara:strand:- start:62 stop:163 length:102 start_codon:yes stop_codon:yes gene_type:complete